MTDPQVFPVKIVPSNRNMENLAGGRMNSSGGRQAMNSFPAKFHSVAVQPGILAAARNRSISRFCSTAVLAALSVVCFNTAKVGAQNLTYAPGDLLLYFMQFGGTQTVMVNLGPAWTYRDATANIMNLVNIGSTLMSAFPSGCAADPMYCHAGGITR